MIDLASAQVDRPGAELLYRGATAFEKALAETEAGELIAIRAELIAENLDPWLVQEKNLPYLAWELGVTLWNDDWGVLKKRQWLADQWLFKSKIGTRKAVDMALDAIGHGPTGSVAILNNVGPTPRFILGKKRTPAEEAELMAHLPEIRIYEQAVPTPVPYASFFGRTTPTSSRHVIRRHSIVYPRAIVINPAIPVRANAKFRSPGLWFMRGERAVEENRHRAFLIREGVTTALEIADLRQDTSLGALDLFRRLFIPNTWKGSRQLGPGNSWRQRWWGKSAADKFVVSFRTSPTKVGGEALVPGTTTVDAAPTAVFEESVGGRFKVFSSHPRRGKFFTPSEAAEHVYSRIRLWEPELLRTIPKGRSHWSRSRRGTGSRNAVVSLQVPVPGIKRKRFFGGPKRGILGQHNGAPLELAMRAISIAKSHRDTVLADLELFFESSFYQTEG